MKKLTILVLLPLFFVFKLYGQSKSQYTIEDWREEIDAYWGEGDPTEKKLAIFDEVWNKIDDDYDCFQNLDIDWNALRDKYRPEIEAGVSHGRFVGIMNSLERQLMETHVHITNKELNLNTHLEPGVPIFSMASFFNNRHFGATLTPLPDSTLLVYKVFADHPIGLKPGDIVLGYEGVPWKELYKNLLEAELPLELGITGSTSEAWDHICLSSAGLNWHLFDTLDVVKYVSGDTLHFPTSLLAGQTGRITGSDQVPVKGVEFWQAEGKEIQARDTENNFTWLDTDNDAEYFTWGILENTQIGYLYVATLRDAMHPGLSANILSAVKKLVNDDQVEGLIFDMRFNNGGSWSDMDDAMAFLFKEDFTTVRFYQRANSADHFLMKQWFQLFGPNKDTNVMLVRTDPNTFFDKPIAVLTGPGCVSAGDQVALKLAYHPNARIFGKSTGGAFAAGFGLNQLSNSSGWLFAQPIANSAWNENTTSFMSHTKLKVDEEVWFDRDSVAKGVDNIVSRAVEWINEEVGTSVDNTTNMVPVEISLEQNYPNPFNPITMISYQIPMTTDVNLSIYNIIGQKVTTLVSEKQNTGSYVVPWDATGFASGVYFYSLETNQGLQKVRKLVLLK